MEKNSSGTVLSKKQHLWVGNTIAEERDSSDTVQKRFYSQGVQIGTTNYFYTHDHLGSTRELVDSTGTIQARYDYDPYGRVTLLQGTNLADFQFCGYYAHQTSGLNLTKYRAYDANTGKWINRDPIAEHGGLNLYRYCNNCPVSHFDTFGLCDCPDPVQDFLQNNNDFNNDVGNSLYAANLEENQILNNAAAQSSASLSTFVTSQTDSTAAGQVVSGFYGVFATTLSSIFFATNAAGINLAGTLAAGYETLGDCGEGLLD